MPSPNLSTNYSVLQAKQDLNGILHGTTTNQVSAIDNIFNRAARNLLLDLDPQETKVFAQTPTIYDQVFDYPISNLPDLKGNKIIDIRPQINRTGRDVFYQTYNQAFDVNKSYVSVPNFTMNFDAGVKSLRIDATDLLTGIVLNQASGIATNGTWSVFGDASNLSVNNINYLVAAGSSLQFDLSASGSSGGIALSSPMTAVDLSGHENQSHLFFWVYLPTGSDVSSVSLRWGSSSANYWERSATTNQQGVSFINGWNQISLAWLGATSVGSPDSSQVDYVRVQVSYNGSAQTAVLVNNIQSILGQIFQIEYYSKYLFRDSTTGVFQETVTDDSNYINLDTETFPVFFNQLAYLTVQQVSNKEYQDDIKFWANEYKNSLQRYMALYKSEVSKPQLTYYRPNTPGYQKFFGTGWYPS
jgi:hypothetical protein